VAALTRRFARALPALLGIAVLGCASAPVEIQRLGAPEPGHAVKRIAVAPPIVAPGARIVESDAGAVIGSRLVEALAGQPEIEYVTPGEVESSLAQRGLSLHASDPQQIGAELARTFGADAVLYATIHDYVSRIGGTRGATRPATVGFDLELRLADGTRLWAGSYREQQQALFDDLLSLPRAAERGFTWLDAPALAAYGSRELVRSLAQERRQWK